jgi:hypothetical protein
MGPMGLGERFSFAFERDLRGRKPFLDPIDSIDVALRDA